MSLPKTRGEAAVLESWLKPWFEKGVARGFLSIKFNC